MSRTVEITVISALGLSQKSTYAVGWIANGPTSTEKLETNVDTQNGKNPSWNHVMKFVLGKAFRQPKEGLVLVIAVIVHTSSGCKEIAQARLNLMEFLKSDRNGACQLPLVGQPNGCLHISVKTDVDFSARHKGKIPSSPGVAVFIRTVEITVISGHGLNNVRTYAVGWIADNPERTQRLATHLDTQNGNNPLWNHVMKFVLGKAFRRPKDGLVLVIAVNAETSSGYKEIGHARLGLKEFLMSERNRACQLPLVGQPNGYLNISVKTNFDFSGRHKRKPGTSLIQLSQSGQ